MPEDSTVTDRRMATAPRKLNLKRTKAEEEERVWRKAQRAARKAHRAPGGSSSPSYPHSHAERDRRSRGRSVSPIGSSRFSQGTSGQDENEAAWMPSQTLAELRAEIEEAHFRAKLFDALDDDQRLDSVEASLNAHIPPRWRSPDSSAGPVDARAEEEEYAEWVRRGMWKRTHRAEVEAQERDERDKAARKEREQVARRAVQIEERQAEEKRAAKRAEKERTKKQQAWTSYQALWDVLNSTAAASSSTTSSTAEADYTPSRPPLTFESLPWPTYPPPRNVDMLTKDAISSFLLSSTHSPGKTRKQLLREALLAYHPDRFIGRYLILVESSQRPLIEDAVGRVIRTLNSLMEEDAPAVA
jgi:hypothetical protein